MASDVFDSIAVKGEVLRAGQVYHFPAHAGTVGATSGMVTNTDLGVVSCPASQTAATWLMPISLKQGTVITSFRVTGQLESAGNVATVDVDLRYNLYGEPFITNVSIGAIAQISKTADYQIDDEKTGLSHEVVTGQQIVAFVTITTAATTDVDFMGVEVTVDET